MTTRRRIAGEEKRADAQLRARVPDPLKARVTAACAELELTESQLVRAAVEAFLRGAGHKPRPGTSD